jgi:hypothetical protein
MEDVINRFVDVRDSLSRQPVYCYKFRRRLPGDDAGCIPLL